MEKWDGFTQGVNLGGWVSQCKHTREHYESFITEDDFRVFSTWNIDHVRVPFDYDLVETKEGEYIQYGFDLLENCIALCRKYGLNMVLDLHKTYGFSFDAGEKESGFFSNVDDQERFYRLWERVASLYGKHKDMLAFELLNEVTDRDFCEPWNRISTECIRRIRKFAPDIKILVGGYWNNSVESVKDLCAPADENIVYNFHCYCPLMFTHQGAGWVNHMPADFRCDFGRTASEMMHITHEIMPSFGNEGMDLLPPDAPLDKQYFVALFSEAVKKAEQEGVALYCGEYGVIDQADRDEAIKWYGAIHGAFEHYGIGHAAWSYKRMDFDLLGRDMSCVLK